MNRDTANKIIHEQIMNECWHEWEFNPKPTARWVCSKCNDSHEDLDCPAPPNYCDDANQAVLVWTKLKLWKVELLIVKPYWRAWTLTREGRGDGTWLDGTLLGVTDGGHFITLEYKDAPYCRINP